MPTTLTGLLLFVVLLLPGFAYLVGKERHGTERHTSPFRETVAVVAASITSEIVVLALFSAIWLVPWSGRLNVGALIRDGRTYFPAHYGRVAAWGTAMLAFAVFFAYIATWPSVRRCLTLVPVRKRLKFPMGTYPHASTVSAWWVLFEDGPDEKDDVQVVCALDDGSAVRGTLASFNNSADDSPDRDIILKKPIKIRLPGASEMIDYNAGFACVSARRIVTLFASYVPSGSDVVAAGGTGSGGCITTADGG